MVISQKTGCCVTTIQDALKAWALEWASHERSKNNFNANQLALHIQLVDLQMGMDGDRVAKCVHWMNVAGGAHWTFDDAALVTQFCTRAGSGDWTQKLSCRWLVS